MVRKKYAAKKRTVRKRSTKKRSVKRPLKRFRKKRATTKVGRLWRYVKKHTKGEMGRKDALIPTNVLYYQSSIRTFFAIAGPTDMSIPYRFQTWLKTDQWSTHVGSTHIALPEISVSPSNPAIATNINGGTLGMFTGFLLSPYPKKGTNPNEISGEEFFLDSLNFTFVCHRREGVEKLTQGRGEHWRGGSISFYLIMEPVASGAFTSFTADNLYTCVFDNTQNWNSPASQPGGSNVQSETVVNALRRDYYNKKRNLNLSPKVKIVRLFRLDYSTSQMAVTKTHTIYISNGTGNNPAGTGTGNAGGYTEVDAQGLPELWHYNTSPDYIKSFKVSVRIKKKLSCVGSTPAIESSAIANFGTKASAKNFGKSYNFWLLPVSTALTTQSTSHVNVETRCEAIFHDV